MIITVNSEKHGIKEVLIDDEDYHLIANRSVWVWTTPRHTSFYAFTSGANPKDGVRLHRLIMGVIDDLSVIVDHKNGNALDNRKCNLRVTSQSNNNKNAKKRKSARTSKFKGVHLHAASKKWKAQIQIDRKKISLGTFRTELEAAAAYNNAAKLYFGEFAVINDLADAK